MRLYLSRLIISSDVEVINAQADTHEGPPGREVIWNASLQDHDDPLVIVQDANDDDDEDTTEAHIMIVWKLKVPLKRPRLRLASPSVVFAASAKLKPAEPIESSATKNEYLPSQTPSGLNLLEPFKDDAALGGVKPRLSALRVSRVSPATQTTHDLVRSLRNNEHTSIKIYPAINARVRYSRPKTPSPATSVLALLDVEVSPFASEMSLEVVDFDIQGGTLVDLSQVSGMQLPLECYAQDDITFLYRLEPNHLDSAGSLQVHDINVQIRGKMNLGAACSTRIDMAWSTTIDFTPAFNQNHYHRSHEAGHPSIDSTTTRGSYDVNIPPPHPFHTNPDSLPSIEITTRHQRSHSTVPDFGITITFTGSSSPLYVGQPFAWSVFIVNRSGSTRKLAILPVARRRRPETRITRPPSTGHGAVRKDGTIADAVIDDNILHAMQRSALLDATDLICLSTDTRVGPLAPGACFEVDLRFLPLRAGYLAIEAVRVVDLGNQEHVDVRDLPGIHVEAEV